MGRDWTALLLTDELRRALQDATGAEVRVTWGARRALGWVRQVRGRLVVDLREVQGDAPSRPDPEATLELEHGRFAWRLHAQVLGYDDATWTFAWPSRAEHRDRRRFDRVSTPDGYALALLGGDGQLLVELVDVSVNGAAFVIPAGHGAAAGDRLGMELVHDGAPPSTVCFEVLGVHDSDGRRVARGRFLPPSADAAGPDEIVMSVDEVARLLGGQPARPRSGR